MMPTRVAGIEMTWPAALINIYQQSDVKLTGEGTIDGDGKPWWDLYWKMRREQYEPKGIALGGGLRLPPAAPDPGLQIHAASKCSGLTLLRPGFWTVHICYSEKVTVDGLKIRNNTEGRGP